MSSSRVRVLTAAGLALAAHYSSGTAWAASSAWTTGGPVGGNVQVLARQPSDPGVVYAGTWGGGVYKSTDAGATWSAANVGLTWPYISSLAIGANPAVLYAGTGGRTGGTIPGSDHQQLFRSTDSGASWTLANNGLDYLIDIAALAVHPTDAAVVYAGTYFSGVFKSTDAGLSWVPYNSGLANPGTRCLALHPTTPDTLYAGTDGGVFKSTGA